MAENGHVNSGLRSLFRREFFVVKPAHAREYYIIIIIISVIVRSWQQARTPSAERNNIT